MYKVRVTRNSAGQCSSNNSGSNNYPPSYTTASEHYKITVDARQAPVLFETIDRQYLIKVETTTDDTFLRLLQITVFFGQATLQV